MKNFKFSLTEPQIERLKAKSKATGLPMSDLIRRAIDADLANVPASDPDACGFAQELPLAQKLGLLHKN